MNALPPVFQRILASIEAQPAMLVRAANKASDRRFSGEPLTGFGALADDHYARRQRIREEAALGLDCVDEDDGEVAA